MKNYSTDLREKFLIAMLDAKDGMRFERQNLTNYRAIYDNMMGNLSKVRTSFFVFRNFYTTLVKYTVDPRDKRKKTYMLTTDGEFVASVLKTLREVENGHNVAA